jgi:hypothetical protein
MEKGRTMAAAAPEAILGAMELPRASAREDKEKRHARGDVHRPFALH